MKAEETLNEKHRQETDQQPADDGLNRYARQKRVGEQVEQPDAQHESGDQANGYLHSGVVQTDQEGDPSAEQRRKHDQRAVCENKCGGRHGAQESGLGFQAAMQKVAMNLMGMHAI